MIDVLESDGSRVWAALTRADMGVWVDWLGAVLNFDKNVVP